MNIGQKRGKIRRIAFASVFLVLTLSFLATGCSLSLRERAPIYRTAQHEPGPPPWAPAHGQRAKHHYYYYPDSGVYFDVVRKLYFHPYAGSWRASASLPSGIQISAGNYVQLDMDSDKPYLHHSEVEKRYPPGHLKKAAKGRGPKWD